MFINDKYLCFWGTSGTYGFLSNWYNSPFRMYTMYMKTSEHAFIGAKAYVFDAGMCKTIFDAQTPKEAKALGRKIKNFDEAVWDEHKENIMYEVNFMKYTQNPDLLRQFLNTYPYELIEASPLDKVWGSGLGEVAHIANWNRNDFTYPGQNLLGKVLTQLRNDLITGMVRTEPGPIKKIVLANQI